MLRSVTHWTLIAVLLAIPALAGCGASNKAELPEKIQPPPPQDLFKNGGGRDGAGEAPAGGQKTQSGASNATVEEV
jgi:hypothetical protein